MKSLIVYGSKKGTTETCVNLLKNYVKGEVDVINLKDNKAIDLEQYGTVIIGSPVYAGFFVKEVKRFLDNNKDRLVSKKIGLFMCCMSNGDMVDKQFNDNIPEEILKVAKAKGNFGGEYKFSKMNFFERFIIKAIAKKDATLGEVDGKTDISKISEKNIEEFAKLI